jgi:type II secretory pathway pseudopilin PulG
MAFTLLELMIAASVIGLVAGLAIPEAFRSLQRSKINAIALELAGWLENLRSHSTSVYLCEAVFNSTATQPLSGGTILYSLSSSTQSGIQANTKISSQASQCDTNIGQIFRIDSSGDSSRFMVNSPDYLWFTRRGDLSVDTETDIKIFLVGSSYLRCLRFQYLLGTVSIGSNNQATSVSSACSDDSFRTF